MKYTRMQAKNILREHWYDLTSEERNMLETVLDKTIKPRDLNKEFIDQRNFGERLSDQIAAFGGSWTFIIGFLIFLVCWSILNTVILEPRSLEFDPYPYVFLNLILSMIAALQAPLIMMSQNRQSKRDRLDAEIDHEVNVRAEVTIHRLNNHIHQLEDKLNHIHQHIIQNKQSPESKS